MSRQHALRSIIRRCAIIWMWLSGSITLAVCGISLLAAGAMFNELTRSHPTDQQMIDNFRAHRAELVQLLQMFQTDAKLDDVAYHFTRPADLQSAGITAERLRAYEALFWRVNLGLAIRPSLSLNRDSTEETIWYNVSSRGLAVSGSVKGYAYMHRSPNLVVDNLDAYRPPDGKPFIAYRHIEGNWYLFFNYDD